MNYHKTMESNYIADVILLSGRLRGGESLELTSKMSIALYNAHIFYLV